MNEIKTQKSKKYRLLVRILVLAIGCVVVMISFVMALASVFLVRKSYMRLVCRRSGCKTLLDAQAAGGPRIFLIFPIHCWSTNVGISHCLCEKIIQWNGLSPENDMSKPGQAIPLVTGILICSKNRHDSSIFTRGPFSGGK